MLRIRVIPVLLLRNGRMVKPIKFGEGGERDVGAPTTTARIYDSQDADELIFLDITATDSGRKPLIETLHQVATNCFIPLTAGGGVRTLDDVGELLRAGADKISINAAAVERPEFISEIAHKYGNQCVVVSIDVRKIGSHYLVFTHRGTKATGLELVAWAKRVASFGAGEILLTAIDHEGTMSGYDLDCIRLVADAVSIPVIAHGGAGTRQHFIDAIHVGHASAVAAASVFHFSDSNISQVKSFLSNAKIPIRIS